MAYRTLAHLTFDQQTSVARNAGHGHLVFAGGEEVRSWLRFG
jgi:hypothetical protein